MVQIKETFLIIMTSNRIKSKKGKSFQIAEIFNYRNYPLILSSLLLLGIVTWSYHNVIFSMYNEWQKNPDSSVGLLVPFIVIVLLWHERKKIKICQIKPCWFLGIVILIISQLTRIWSLVFFYQSGIRYSFVLTIAGIVLMILGTKVFRTVVFILLFLFLMVPTPTCIQNSISAPLQNLAVSGTVFLLEVFSIEVVQKGNVVMLNGNIPMAVAEACNGLRLLTAFIIVTASLIYFMKCSRFHKFALLLSSIPIAIVCNIIRLCLTAAVMMIISVEVGQRFFHDFAGLSMMPIAVLLLFAELRLMDKIFVPEPSQTNKIVKNLRSTYKIKAIKPKKDKKSKKFIVAKD
jgi:exosortase